MTDKTIELIPSGPDKEQRVTIYGDGGIAFRSIGPRGGWYYQSVAAAEVPKLLAFVVSELPAIKALVDYAADAPNEAVGEGYWDDMEAACGDGMRQERSEAAELIRDALKALGIEPPPGFEVCEDCHEPKGEEHHYQCSHDGEEEDQDEDAEAVTA